MLEPIPAVLAGPKAGYTLERSPISHKANKENRHLAQPHPCFGMVGGSESTRREPTLSYQNTTSVIMTSYCSSARHNENEPSS